MRHSPPQPDADPAGSPDEPLLRLWWRYIWPFEYFRDCSRGSRIERAQSYRHNRSMRRFLPGFILKWLAITACWFASGHLLDATAGFVIPAACCFVTGTWTGVVALLLFVSWSWLGLFPELY
jgi:hypothetical protein